MTDCRPSSSPVRHRPGPVPPHAVPPSCRPATLVAYGCGPEEATAFRVIAPRHRVTVTTVERPLIPDNAGLAAGHRIVSVGHRTPVTNRTLRALREVGVRHVSTRSVGRDHIDVAHAKHLGISVGTVAYSPDSVADHTLMVMLMVLRHAKNALARVDGHDYLLPPVRGRELRDLTVGVVGTGRIGTAVLHRLRGFGAHTLAWDARRTGASTYVALDDLLCRSDLVTLHIPLTADTHHLLDRHRIEDLRPGAIVVNTARGGLLDTEALLVALESGRLGGAALDVVEGEQGVFYTDHRRTPPDGPLLSRLERLRRLANVVVTPHTAYHTDHALRDTIENTLAACLAVEANVAQGVAACTA